MVSVAVARPRVAHASTHARERRQRASGARRSNAPRALKEVLKPESKNSKNMRRVPLPGTLGSEIERVLGGGVVPGGLVLVGGDPGVGKSTILLQLAGLLGKEATETAKKVKKATKTSEESEAGEESMEEVEALFSGGGVLYASGEESVEQVASRAERMEINQDLSLIHI